jgi:hypothetical protein
MASVARLMTAGPISAAADGSSATGRIEDS